MSGGNVSARDAALSIILGDVEPLVQRVEESALLLATVEKELSEDLTKLGALVQRLIDGQAELNGSVKRVHDTVANAQAIASAVNQRRPAGQAPSPRAPGARAMFFACLASSILGAALVGGTLYLVGHDLVDQARVGRSLTQAWPSLDEATRKRVEQVLNGPR